MSQGWDVADEKQEAILKALQDSKVFDGTFVKAKPGEGRPDIMLYDQANFVVKHTGGEGDAEVQNMVNALDCGHDLSTFETTCHSLTSSLCHTGVLRYLNLRQGSVFCAQALLRAYFEHIHEV